MENIVTVGDVIKKLQSIPAKQRELPLLILAKDAKEGVASMFMGIETDKGVNFPQIGEEPNCVVIRITDTAPKA